MGHFSEKDIDVYVAEDLMEIRAAIKVDITRRVGSVVIALLCSTLIIHIVLWFTLQRPLTTLRLAVMDIGKGNLGLQVDPIGTKDLGILANSINSMSRALADAKNDHIVQMKKALNIQTSLLPLQISLKGFNIASHFQPAEEVGGDYYDLIELPDGSGLICIADVTGHGVSAALVSGMVKICLLNASEHWTDPGKILGFVDRRLSSMNLPDMFVSMMLIRIESGKSSIEFAGAGHPSSLVLDQDGRFRELQSSGPLLGIGMGFEWTTEVDHFATGERLVMYTDGVTEACGISSSLFGLGRLMEVLASTHDQPPEKSIETIMKHLDEFVDGQKATDDITLVMIDPLATN